VIRSHALVTVLLVGSALLGSGCGDGDPAPGGAAAPEEGALEASPLGGAPASPAADATADAPPEPPAIPEPTEPLNEEIRTESGLVYVNLAHGEGAPALPGQTVRVHYVGTLEDGKRFDASYDHPGAQPYEFQIGRSRVIQAWHEGIAGMRVGGKRKLIVPPHLGYGERGFGPIPGNATLHFEVELVEIR